MRDPHKFRCGHPRTPENSKPTSVSKADGTRYMQCKFCTDVRDRFRKQLRFEARMAKGKLTIGERVCMGLL